MTVVTTYYLEMTSPAQLRPKRALRTDLVLGRVLTPQPELNRFFYTAVGGGWYWYERLPWTYADWRKYLDRAELQTWVLSASGVPAGYFELEAQAGGDIEIVYFGLLPAYVGQGLGGHLLTCAVEQAWALNVRRVWLHTCTLDHPQALANYAARGFQVTRQETTDLVLPPQPLGPWPGA
jgi:ribosomal protein S18 acetylase RimI-like enzyme